jgi:hypothetical protein
MTYVFVAAKLARKGTPIAVRCCTEASWIFLLLLWILGPSKQFIILDEGTGVNGLIVQQI